MARKTKEEIEQEVAKKKKVVKNLETRIILLIVGLCVGICGTLVVGYTLSFKNKCNNQTESVANKDTDTKEEKYGKGKVLNGGYRQSDYDGHGDCEHFENDGTSDGKETCTYELGNLVDKEKNQYSIKQMRYYDGESKSAGYTYEFYINDNLTDIKSNVLEAKFIGDYVFVVAWSSNTDNDGQFLIDAKTGKTLLALDPSSIQFNDTKIIYTFEQTDGLAGINKEKYLFYNACSNSTLTNHRVDLDNLSDTIVYTENNVVCADFY